MPSNAVLPTIQDLLNAGRKAIASEQDTYADQRVGSLHDHECGPVAILFSREAEQDKDQFEDIYFNAARGDALTTLVQGRYPGLPPRVLATAGTGVASFQRANATAGAGTLWAGTRIQVAGTPPQIIKIATDTPVGTTQTFVSNVPIVASFLGPGSTVSASGGLALLDPLYDPLWLPQSVVCGEGTAYEPADDYRARVLAARLNARNGYIPEMRTVCQAQGATYVIAFASQYGLTNDDTGFANDYGQNALYVADANFGSTPTLIQNCVIALESARVLGADLWVGGIAQSLLYVQALINLVEDPGRLDVVTIRRACTQALLGYFGSTASGFTFKRDALAGVMVKAHPAVQKVASWTSPAADVTLAPTNWPAVLTRFVLQPRYIQLAFTGPS